MSTKPRFANPVALDEQAPSPLALTDEQVIQHVRAGKTDQFELLMRRHNQKLFRLLKSMGLENAEAEDVMQDAYLRAFQNLSQFQGNSLFSTWLMRIAMNTALDRRRSHRDAVRFEDVADRSAIGDQPVRSAELCELRCVLSAAVQRLPEHLRLVFVLREVEGLSGGEVAECLGISESNEKVRLHRAKEQLQAWIDQRLGAEARRLYEFAGDRCNRIVAGVLRQLHQDGSGDNR